jgi:hypothetical protein
VPAAPRGGTPAMVIVNAHPLAVSSLSAPGTFTFRNDSAGLGIPREDFGDLKNISADVARHGEANTPVERVVIGPISSRANSAEASRRSLGNGVYEQHEPPSALRPAGTMSRNNTGARGNASQSESSAELMRGMNSPASPSGRMSSSTSSSGSSSSTSGGSHR